VAKGDFFLMKKPLECVLSVYSYSETAVVDFFMEEIGPVIYNLAIADAQLRLQQRVMDLNGELFADEFQYWVRQAAKRKGRK
jgi:uncharacterized protein (DUF2164 family)